VGEQLLEGGLVTAREGGMGGGGGGGKLFRGVVRGRKLRAPTFHSLRGRAMVEDLSGSGHSLGYSHGLL